MTSKQESNKLEIRPQYCGECRYIEYRTNLVDLGFFDDKRLYCIQARLNVSSDEKACPWGLKEDKPKK